VGANYHNIMTNQWVWHPGFDFANDYHVYTLVWKEGDIQKWVDGTWVKGTYFTWQGSDPQVLINLAIGGSTNNNPNAATFPSVYRIDYFRVWTRG
jgi:beta-glucanase (GH16 family)